MRQKFFPFICTFYICNVGYKWILKRRYMWRKWICKIVILCVCTNIFETWNQLSMWSFYINNFQTYNLVFIYLYHKNNLFSLPLWLSCGISPFRKHCFLNSFFFFFAFSNFHLQSISWLEMLPERIKKKSKVCAFAGRWKQGRGRKTARREKDLNEKWNECFTCWLLAQLPYLRKYAEYS